MLHSFDELEAALAAPKRRPRVVLAGAEDDIALAAVVRARRSRIVDATLVGDEDKICALLEGMGESADDYRIVSASSEMQAARTAVKLVCTGEADFPMKGRMQTASYLMAIRFGGLVEADGLVNEYTVFHYADQNRMLVCGDCAVNIEPSFEEKRAICTNLIGVARSLGVSPVKVAALSIVEKPDPAVPSSMDAHELAQLDWGEDVLVDGPFALDNALDAEAAAHKGVTSAVAGHADVILVPDVQAGNVLHKAAHFFGHYPFASGLLGASVPVVMNSRTDDEDAKYYSILMACAQLGDAGKGGE